MVWLKTFKLSALGRQPEVVEYCICVLFSFVLLCLVLLWCCVCVLAGYYVSILVDAMIQVWGCLATSPLRYRRIQEMFMFLSDY